MVKQINHQSTIYFMQDSIGFKELLEKHLSTVGIACLVLLVLFLSYKTFFAEPIKKILIGNTAPHFKTVTIDNEPFEIKDHIGNKIILLNIWATWCPTCVEEVPMLNAIQHRFKDYRFSVIGVMEDFQHTHRQLRDVYNNFILASPIIFPVVVDPENYVAELYGTYKLPESYLIDWGGNVVYKHEGPITPDDKLFIMSMIEQIL